ncbi:MAG: SpoVR family protein [Fimbriimonadia bacterium]|nr:SpoVR family protein [Fimbriimonadia bacterium]
MTQAERAELEKWIEIIYEKALEMGLDPFPVHFEVAPAHVIYELGAYALPARFSHWTFGRDYHVQKTMYEYGLTRIYELVFNANPSQAFLLDVNDMLAHKLVIAHVYGHSDFFKNNIYFEHTDRQMIERARLHGERLRGYELQYGPMEVERFLDSVLSIEEHIDSSIPTYGHPEKQPPSVHQEQIGKQDNFEDMLYLTEPKPKPVPPTRKIPPEPQKDILLFLRDYSKVLTDWQRDIISMVREEMTYFIPQIKTKIINEGWASFWHERILENLPLTADEHIMFRKMHSGVIQPGSRTSLNPYYVGYKILRSIERRWDGTGDMSDEERDWMDVEIRREPGQGMKKLFEVREQESDQTFLHKYLTEGLVKELDLYTYRVEENDGELVWVVDETDWRVVRNTLVDQMTNFGIPLLTVEDGDWEHRGELYVKHHYDGKPLDLQRATRCMRYMHNLWGRPVHIETVIDDEEVLLTFDGNNIGQRAL